MGESQGLAAPFSPILLAGLAARPVPLRLLQSLVDRALAVVQERHPDLFERLEDLDNPVILIDPVDVPLVFVLRPDCHAPRLTVRRQPDDADGVTATIRGPLLTLIDLLEGRLDGDALFFSRSLVIEGDTEAVVALRNGVDGAEIDLIADAASLFGPLAGLAERFGRRGRRLLDTATADFATLGTAILAPALRQQQALAARVAALEGRHTSATGAPEGTTRETIRGRARRQSRSLQGGRQ